MSLTYLVETDWAVHWLRGNKFIATCLHNNLKWGKLSLTITRRLYGSPSVLEYQYDRNLKIVTPCVSSITS